MIIGNAIYLGGTPLPTLTNPAVAGDIRYSKQSIDGGGEVLTGTIPDYEGETDTGSVVPVDTGENGLLKRIIDGTAIADNLLYDTLLTDIAPYGLSGVSYRAVNNRKVHFAEFENVVSLGSYSVGTGYCYIERIKFNKNVLFDGNAMRQNSSLKVVDCAAITTSSASTYVFRESSVTSFIIRSDTLCALAASNFFANAPTGLKVYVPPSLVASYKSATNWTYSASRINPFYIAPTVADIATMLADPDIPDNSLIICDAADYTQKYTVKEPVVTP